jgi:Leucine-rich repeat (LRR) protein
MSDESITSRKLPAWALLAGVTALALGARLIIAVAERGSVFRRATELTATALAVVVLAAAVGTFIGRRWINRPSALLLGVVFAGIAALLLAGSSNIVAGLGAGFVVGSIGLFVHDAKRVATAGVAAIVAGAAVLLAVPAENTLIWGCLGGAFAFLIYGYRASPYEPDGRRPRMALAARTAAVVLVAILAAWWGSLAPIRATIAQIKASNNHIGFRLLTKGPLRSLRKSLEASALFPARTVALSMAEPELVARLGQLTALEELELADMTLDEQAFAGLAQAPALVSLQLNRCQVSEAAWSELARIPQLSILILRQTEIGTQGVAALAAIPSLKTLVLDNNGPDATALNAFAGHTGLTELHLAGPSVTAEFLQLLDRLPSITTLSLSNLNHASPTGRATAAVRPLPYSSGGTAELNAVRRARSLKSLQVAVPLDQALQRGLLGEASNTLQIQIGNSGTFSPDPKNPDGPVVIADLSNTGALVGLPLLFEPRQELRQVNVSACRLEAGDLALIAALPKLDTLILDHATMPPDALRELVSAPRLSSLSLQSVAMPNWPQAIEDAFPQLPALRELNLADNGLVDTDLANLSALPTLRALTLKGNPLTDAALAHLSGMTSLEQLDLRETQVTAAGVQSLRERLPKLEIRWSE